MRRASVPVASPCPPTQVIGRPPPPFSFAGHFTLSYRGASGVVRPRRSFESGSFCHTGPYRRVVCLLLAPAGFFLSIFLVFSRGSPPFPLSPTLWSVRSPFLLVSFAPSRHPHRFKRGADPSVVLSLRHVLSSYASPAHNIHFHHLSRRPARRFTVRLGGGVRRSPRPALHPRLSFSAFFAQRMLF